jgi:UDP-N-acetylmuramoylalanine--D-glutamate ligase
VAYYDDSKATTPASVVTALRSFPSVVLIAGGKNKGLDLQPLATAADHVRAVVTIGSAADDVAAVFDGLRPVVHADSMDAAVNAAATLAQPGDVVLLSPACTSWDAYRDYAARGDDFARAVHERQRLS